MNLPNPPMAESAGLREIKSYLSVLSAELRRILLNLDESNLSAEALSRLKASFSKADAASKLLNRFTVRGDFTGKASGIIGILPLENGGTGASDDADARANLGLADTGFQNAELCPGVTVPAGSAVGWRRIGNHVFAQAHPVFSYSASQIAIASGFPAPPRDLCFLFIASSKNVGCAELTQSGRLNVIWVYSMTGASFQTSGTPGWTSMTFDYFVDE